MPFSSVCLLLFDLTTRNERVWEKKEKTQLQKKEKKETISFVKEIKQNLQISLPKCWVFSPVFNMEKPIFIYKHLLWKSKTWLVLFVKLLW